jgi:hypothetical protein
MKKTTGLLILLLAFSLALAACGKKKTEEPVEVDEVNEQIPEVTPEPAPAPEPVSEAAIEETPAPVDHTNEVRSHLNGLYIPKEYENKRPYAVMLNTLDLAYPQSGTSETAILYEILAEGGITRFMGLFDYISGEKVGSVRSARHYYVEYAKEYDAIYVHVGQTPYALDMIKKLKVDDINGLYGEGNVAFYRDNSIKAPHNTFTSAKGIEEGRKYKNIDDTLPEGYVDEFKFEYTDDDSEGIDISKREGAIKADKVTFGYSYFAESYMNYDAENTYYTRNAFGSDHIDKNTGEKLTFETLLVQFVNEYNKDKNGYQTMELAGANGKGYLVNNGYAVPIYWSKASDLASTHYFYDEAKTDEIVLNPGRIYVSVFPNNRTEYLKFE